MLKLVNDDWTLGLVKDDPVRPHLPMSWRISNGREVYVLENDDSTPRAVVCVAYTNGVALDEEYMDTHWKNPNTAMFYTVWSYDKGAGREIIFCVADSIQQQKPHIHRYCTLSPLTEMAEKFHLRNGASFLRRGDTCQNFEYTLT